MIAASAQAAPGDVYVADRGAGPGGTGAIFRVDIASGQRTVLASGPPLVRPTDMVIDDGPGRDRCDGKGSKDRATGCERSQHIP